MLQEHDIEIRLKCQQYNCESYIRNEDETESVFLFESKQKTEEVSCPMRTQIHRRDTYALSGDPNHRESSRMD